MLPSADRSAELGSRLESWKEIASSLGRDVRTVQRWEKTQGLPVYRQVRETSSSVHAYSAELDAWRAQRIKAPGAVGVSVNPGRTPGRPYWPMAVALALALVTSGDH